ncbi:MAG: 50S ribosomal protein L23 [Flavobacteriales bacterium]|nr:MAG: 50S ribosomal protein L23 [Chlorobi bacterium OLB6]MBE2266414.1 50S ribosomal protein L23 [Flavobacteriales bacterium]MBV6463641.1 50S ribosomal protein L23 [Chlorobiota bacterium]MBW7854381.1 50S ribosomal protein L23 [Candidatus Kapabacteria bacterium]MCC6331723.1 50S ribosomal protein L23 [Ignavibacteria bacterium]
MITVLKRPIITEKATKLGHLNQYVFEVDPNANKIQIKEAVKAMFEVDPVSIRTVRIKGKIRQRMTRKGIQRGRTNLKKKAYITLKEGQSIDIVAGGGEE